MNYLPLREQLCEIGKRCWHKGWVAANDGNFSIRIDSNTFLTTPTGVSKGFMTPDMLLLVDSHCRPLEDSPWKPSSEFKMHMRCYDVRPDIGSVVHAHPPVSTAFASAHIPLNTPILAEILMTLGEIPVAPYGKPGTIQIPDSITPLLPAHNAILLSNHGAVTMGDDLLQAYYRMETVEHTAKVFLFARLLGGGVPLTPEQVTALTLL